MLRIFYPMLREVRNPDETLAVEGEELRYLMLARRSRIGDACQLFDGQGHTASATLSALTPHVATLRAQPPTFAAPLRPRILVVQAILKGDRMDLCLEKLVETGADEILLVNAERTIAKAPPAKSPARQQRWASQLLAAARQSERAYVPVAHGPLDLREALALVPATATKRATDPNGAPWPMRAEGEARPAELALAVGPEGGFTPEEYAVLAAAGFLGHAISPNILRAETAGPVAVALARVL